MKVCWNNVWKSLRHVAPALALLVACVAPAAASDYGYRGGGYRHYHPKPQPQPQPRPVVNYSSGSRNTHTYSAHYRQGGGGYGWLNQWSRGSNGNGYTGPNTYINTPHRADWNAKLQAQRQWDEQQFKNMQKEDASNVRCGLSNAPAYCYRLQGPYPKEMHVVRY